MHPRTRALTLAHASVRSAPRAPARHAAASVRACTAPAATLAPVCACPTGSGTGNAGERERQQRRTRVHASCSTNTRTGPTCTCARWCARVAPLTRPLSVPSSSSCDVHVLTAAYFMPPQDPNDRVPHRSLSPPPPPPPLHKTIIAHEDSHSHVPRNLSPAPCIPGPCEAAMSVLGSYDCTRQL